MPARTKKSSDERPAWTDVYAELVSCNTDPAQYKPYNPHLDISNAEQRVFVHLRVPSSEVESNTIVKRQRVIVTTVEGMTIMLKHLAADMQAAIISGG
jgi:hypothetical protein